MFARSHNRATGSVVFRFISRGNIGVASQPELLCFNARVNRGLSG
jgi:hypothetical protein